MPPPGTQISSPSHSAAAGSFLSILAFSDQLAPGAASRLRAGVLAGIALDGVDARGPAEKLPELLGAAVELTRADDLGLRLAKAADPRRFGVVTYAASTSPTLRAAYERTARYMGLWNEGVRLELDRDRAACLTSIVLRPQGKTAMAAPDGLRQLAELGSAAMLMLGRSFTGAPISPVRVELASSAPADVRPHQHLFAAPIAWNAPVAAPVISPRIETPEPLLKLVWDFAMPTPPTDPPLADPGSCPRSSKKQGTRERRGRAPAGLLRFLRSARGACRIAPATPRRAR